MSLTCDIQDIEQKIQVCRAIARHQEPQFLTQAIKITRARYYRSLLKRRQLLIDRGQTIQALQALGVQFRLINNVFYI